MTTARRTKKTIVNASNAAEIERMLRIPRRTVAAFDSPAKVRQAFSLPVSLGAPREEREALDMAFDSAGGYSAIWESLQQHAQEMGQFPVTSFIGYGALQQIAQNGMIRACVQTVADDITREWIKIEGGDGTAPEAVQALEDAVNDKYHLKDLIHKAAATVGYMIGRAHV